MGDDHSASWRPSTADLKRRLEERGMLQEGNFAHLTFHDLGSLLPTLLDMLHVCASALSADGEEAERIAEGSVLAHRIRALVRVLAAMESGQQVQQLIPAAAPNEGKSEKRADRQRVYDHPARREAKGVAVEAYEVLHSRCGMKKRAASEQVSDVFADLAAKLDLDWSPSARTIREDWAPPGSPSGTPRFDAFCPSGRHAAPEEVVRVLASLLSGPLAVLAEHVWHNPPANK